MILLAAFASTHLPREAAALQFLNAAQLAAAPQWTFTEQQFNGWICNNVNEPPQKRLAAQIALEIKALDDVVGLNPLQREKLELAGATDLARFDGRVAALRDKYVGKTYDQNKINELFQLIQPLQQQIQAGLLGPSSVFARVRRGILTEDQQTEFRRVEDARGDFRYHAKVRLFVAGLDRALGLREQQRQALLELLVEETRRPAKFGQRDWYYVMWQASRLPTQKLQAIFDAQQLPAVQQSLQRGKGYEGFLKNEGIVPVDAPPPPKKPPLVKPPRDGRAVIEEADA